MYLATFQLAAIIEHKTERIKLPHYDQFLLSYFHCILILLYLVKEGKNLITSKQFLNYVQLS